MFVAIGNGGINKCSGFVDVQHDVACLTESLQAYHEGPYFIVGSHSNE